MRSGRDVATRVAHCALAAGVAGVLGGVLNSLIGDDADWSFAAVLAVILFVIFFATSTRRERQRSSEQGRSGSISIA